ncbi:MAG TPA: universal stress protein, partial [Acidimicrobiales bacterium]|nr:universal stress protein [Acidimicrobiales bacterium]
MADTEVHVLICYDGSEHAKHAIEGASKLFPGAPTTVLYVTESLAHMLQRYPSPDSFVGDIPFETVDANNAEAGSSIADEGAALAIKAGM